MLCVGHALARALACNNALQWLDVSMTNLGESGYRAIGKALTCNGSLQLLNLADNYLVSSCVRDFLDVYVLFVWHFWEKADMEGSYARRPRATDRCNS